MKTATARSTAIADDWSRAVAAVLSRMTSVMLLLVLPFMLVRGFRHALVGSCRLGHCVAVRATVVIVMVMSGGE